MAKKSQNAYVQISSTKTIQVTCGLQFEDVTNKDAHVPDRLRVLPKWGAILIKKGVGIYPAEILEWKTVKAMIEAKIFTVDNNPSVEPDDKAKEMKSAVEELNAELSPLQDATQDVKGE